jgi:dTDP-4-dehydrorhamnose reductase
VLQSEARGVVNVTNQGSTTWYDFAREIFRQTEMAVEIEPISSAEYNAPAPRPAYSVLDDELYRRLGGPPLLSWKEALAAYLVARREPSPEA